MKNVVIAVSLGVLISTSCYAEDDDRYIKMLANPSESVPGGTVHIQCIGDGEWRSPLVSAKIVIKNSRGVSVVGRDGMQINGLTARYDYTIPKDAEIGNTNVLSKTGRIEPERLPYLLLLIHRQ